MKEKFCKECGKLFTPKNTHSLYCDACREKPAVNCPVCDKKFVPIKRRKKFCSLECYIEDRESRKLARLATCEFCGKEFVKRQTNRTQHYCSQVCYKKAQKTAYETNSLIRAKNPPGECIRCSRPAVPGSDLCEYHQEILRRKEKKEKTKCI